MLLAKNHGMQSARQAGASHPWTMELTRRLSTLALLCIAATVTAPTAHAQFTNACGGGNFFSCVTLAVSGQGTSTLLFSVTNSSNTSPANNANSDFKEFGVGNVAYTGAAPTVTATGALSSNFDVATTNGSSFSGFGYTDDDFYGLTPVTPDVPAHGLHDGQSVGFFLAFANATDATDFLDNSLANVDPTKRYGFEFAVHDLTGYLGSCESSKAAFDRNGTALAGSGSPANFGTCNGPASTVPEPSSMALVGTGLFGLVPIIRRRRK